MDNTTKMVATMMMSNVDNNKVGGMERDLEYVEPRRPAGSGDTVLEA